MVEEWLIWVVISWIEDDSSSVPAADRLHVGRRFLGGAGDGLRLPGGFLGGGRQVAGGVGHFGGRGAEAGGQILHALDEALGHAGALAHGGVLGGLGHLLRLAGVFGLDQAEAEGFQTAGDFADLVLAAEAEDAEVVVARLHRLHGLDQPADRPRHATGQQEEGKADHGDQTVRPMKPKVIQTERQDDGGVGVAHRLGFTDEGGVEPNRFLLQGDELGMALLLKQGQRLGVGGGVGRLRQLFDFAADAAHQLVDAPRRCRPARRFLSGTAFLARSMFLSMSASAASRARWPRPGCPLRSVAAAFQ